MILLIFYCLNAYYSYIFVTCIFSTYWLFLYIMFFFKQKTAYEMRMSYWSSDVCSSDLDRRRGSQARVSSGSSTVMQKPHRECRSGTRLACRTGAAVCRASRSSFRQPNRDRTQRHSQRTGHRPLISVLPAVLSPPVRCPHIPALPSGHHPTSFPTDNKPCREK